MLSWTLDRDQDAAYLRLSDEPVATQEVLIEGQLIVDLDHLGRPVGIEAVGAQARTTMFTVIERYNLKGMEAAFVSGIALPTTISLGVTEAVGAPAHLVPA